MHVLFLKASLNTAREQAASTVCIRIKRECGNNTGSIFTVSTRECGSIHSMSIKFPKQGQKEPHKKDKKY
jgi:hypothetical protein